MSRKYTNKLLELVDNDELDKDVVIQACLDYMSEDDVKDMMMANDFGTVNDVGEIDLNDYDEYIDSDEDNYNDYD